MGGIYKHMFEPGDAAQIGRFRSNGIQKVIDGELERVVKPMMKHGGLHSGVGSLGILGNDIRGIPLLQPKT